MSTETPETEDSDVPDPQTRRLKEKETRKAAKEEAAADVIEGETVELKVFRYDPEIADKQEPRFDTFHVPKFEGMTVLDALMDARDRYDPTLTFRHSCRQAVCGSDALFVNGRQRLACKTQTVDLDEPIQIEPLPHRPVVKDLVVDMEHFYDQMRSVEPFFDPDELPGPDQQQLQTPENREQVKMSTRCIWCGACMSSCNIAAGDNQYLGPAALNKAYRFYFDEREGENRQEERLKIVEEEHGVWRCQTQFSCTEVCPKDIPLTEHIQALKREAVKNNLKFW
ncbi:Succinate dehydrogenase/fumarate reductase, Fe-Sprotein subunit [Halanaeroarchaeum sp. HSR-CO]|uniref:succinate dehydrogenase/fumarate reductase iron-sulfur subunit n=1 Tax=Halanaeroarchaeum sp. HSR-CO TaxID=2866382 RepID=UPI00217E4F97|nr:succinate dehydrogenase/fumarate reductase iron-sulfur subunit [Halanaeroarchaeum sp. HSR-CO]UWG48404.1 Succinate dehydrogenase/fumarate reductase, Fe-Sprotein subunit [Halanaeroarchaeum sp. HSR-CO]